MSVSDEQQRLRDFIDALRICIGLGPLYRRVPSLPDWYPVASDGNRRTSSIHGTESVHTTPRYAKSRYAR